MSLNPRETALLANVRIGELLAQVERDRQAAIAEAHRPSARHGGRCRRLGNWLALVVGWLDPSGPPLRRVAATPSGRFMGSSTPTAIVPCTTPHR